MQINLLAVGHNMPVWVNDSFSEYTKRLPQDYHLSLSEVKPEKRNKNSNIKDITTEEGKRLINTIPQGNWVIALDEQGQLWNTNHLATKLEQWHDDAQDISLLIGGADGLSEDVKSRANTLWSLSSLTLPHPLVRVIIAEQIYRAWSIICGHPYHRA